MDEPRVANVPTPIALRVNSGNLLPWMSDEERDANVMLLDFDVDREGERELRIDLNVVFNPIPVRRGMVTLADYYIGSTGAKISVKASRGVVRDWTQAATLSVEYTNTTKRQRKVGVSISPSVKKKSGSDELDLEVGSITRDATEERSYTASFASEERLLTPQQMNDTIKWTIAVPHGEKVIRDFIAGNLYLFAECCWASDPKSGRITIRPSNILFFDAKRRELNLTKSLLMRYVLWLNDRHIANPDGFVIDFEELP